MYEANNHHNCRLIPAIRATNQTLLKISTVVAILLWPVAIHGQNRGDSPTASLAPHTREVVERLGRLRSLEAGSWKHRDGDLPHGEEPNLDDSSWQATDRLNKASKGVIWFRRWFEMPKRSRWLRSGRNTYLAAVSSRRTRPFDGNLLLQWQAGRAGRGS